MADAMMLDIQTIGGYCGAFIAMGGLAGLISKFVTKDIQRDVADVAREIKTVSNDATLMAANFKHDLKNQISKIDALDHERTKDVERIVKLELRQENIERGQAEIKQDAQRNHREVLDAMKAWADQFAESIRELRDARLKP